MIHVADLSKSYGPVRALDRVSFDVSPGEILGFLGPNGAGKSTTLRILTGFLPADAGTVTVAGFDIRTDSLRARAVTGYLPEGVPVYPEMRVVEYLNFRARLKGVSRSDRRRAVSSVLERAGVADVERRIFGTLSKGYRQRVGLADALLGDPRILVLDEPSVGLDPEQLRQFRSLLIDLGKTRTVVLSTHILSEVEPVASRVAIIFRGRIVAQDAPAALRRRLGGLDLVTAEVGPGKTGARPEEVLREVGRLPEVSRASLEEVPREWKRHRGQAGAGALTPGDVHPIAVRPRGESDPREAIFTLVRDRGWVLRELTRSPLTLEEIFMEVIEGEEEKARRSDGEGKPLRTGIANVTAIFRREVSSYFLSPVAYVAMCLFLLVNGWIFYYKVLEFKGEPQQINLILAALFGAVPFWALFLSPVITMRLIAEEKRTGTLEGLMTAPVTAAQVVLGKFLAAELFFVLVWSTLLLHVIILALLGQPDLGPVIAVYIGLASLGFLMNALGLLASALTRNQVIAVIAAFLGNMLVMFGGMARSLFPDDAEAEKFFDFVGIPSHFTREYYRGVVDLRFIALDLLLGAAFLILAVRALEARRWR